eukprot:403355154
MISQLDVFLHYMFFADGIIKNMSLVFLERTKFSCFSLIVYYFSAKATTILPNSKIWIIVLRLFIWFVTIFFLILGLTINYQVKKQIKISQSLVTEARKRSRQAITYMWIIILDFCFVCIVEMYYDITLYTDQDSDCDVAYPGKDALNQFIWMFQRLVCHLFWVFPIIFVFWRKKYFYSLFSCLKKKKQPKLQRQNNQKNSLDYDTVSDNTIVFNDEVQRSQNQSLLQTSSFITMGSKDSKQPTLASNDNSVKNLQNKQ